MRTFFREFKDFIVTGNMLELAVAVILAGAIGAVIKASTDGILMQAVAAIFGQPDFSDIFITLRENVGTDPTTGQQRDSVLQIGLFLNALIALILTGLVLFVIIKAYNRMKAAKPDAVGPTDVEVLMEIRDLLSQQRQP